MENPRVGPFVVGHRRYDDWFERHRAAYLSELLAVRALAPWSGRGVEVGVGTGRFAAPLGVEFGIDPAAEMLNYARARGVRVVQALAEALPFALATFDYALVVATLCFVYDPTVVLSQARHVLKPGGVLVIGFIDRNSDLGRYYLAHNAESAFYREARFYSADDIGRLLAGAGFTGAIWVQTLYKPLQETRDIEPVRPGRGEGAFVVVKAIRPPFTSGCPYRGDNGAEERPAAAGSLGENARHAGDSARAVSACSRRHDAQERWSMDVQRC